MSIETDVMEAAAALKLAVDRAQAAGYHVNWPLRASDIGSIAVSETGKVAGALGFFIRLDTSSLEGGETFTVSHDLAFEPEPAKPKKSRT